MTVLTKHDLQDWNSHPVTQQIFKEIEHAINEIKGMSTLRDTVDQTAMQAAFAEGQISGAQLLKESYEDLAEDA